MGSGAEAMKYRFKSTFAIFFRPTIQTRCIARAIICSRAPMAEQAGKQSGGARQQQMPEQGPSGRHRRGQHHHDDVRRHLCRGRIVREAGADLDARLDGRSGAPHRGWRQALWTNVTPKGLPEWMRINTMVEASPSVSRYRLLRRNQIPSWTISAVSTRPPIIEGTAGAPVNSGIGRGLAPIREIRIQVEYAVGTETGVYVSFNQQVDAWQSFQLNLPVVPITDLASGSGRSWWWRRRAELSGSSTIFHFLTYRSAACPRKAQSYSNRKIPIARCAEDSACHPMDPRAKIRPSGAVVYYSFQEKPKDEVTLEFLDDSGKLIRKFSSKPPAKKPAGAEDEEEEFPPRRPDADRVPTEGPVSTDLSSGTYAIRMPPRFQD